MKSIFITVRSDSTRLPNKSFIEICGKKTIEILIDRIKKSKKKDNVILCTSTRTVDDQLCEIAKKNEINFYRGSLEDKLDRWNNACKHYDVDFFVTADGDDLFCEPSLIDLAFEQYENDPTIDFIKADNVICGAFTYGIKAAALEKVCQIKNTSNTEMMWVYFTDTGLFKIQQLNGVKESFYRNDIRMTLDYEDDYRFFHRVLSHFEEKGNKNFDLQDIVELIDAYPDIADINIQLQEVWKKNQEKNIKLILK